MLHEQGTEEKATKHRSRVHVYYHIKWQTNPPISKAFALPTVMMRYTRKQQENEIFNEYLSIWFVDGIACTRISLELNNGTLLAKTTVDKTKQWKMIVNFVFPTQTVIDRELSFL